MPVYGSWRYVYVALFAAVAFVVIFPMLSVVFGSFWGAPPGRPGGFTFQGYINTYGSDLSTYRVLFNSFFIAGAKTVMAVVSGVFLAWVVTRTDTPGARALETLLAVPFFVPSVLTALGWAMLANPRTGSINKLLMMLPGVETPVLNIYSMSGIIWHMWQFSTAFVFILIVPAFRNMDPSLEDSSRMSGSGNISTLFRITLPLMKPAILGATLLTFIRGLEAFDTPVLLGVPANILVFSTSIYVNILGRFPPRYAEGMALSVSLMLIAMVLIVIQWRMLGAKQYTTISGKGYQPRLIRLGPAKWVALAFCSVYVLVALVLPVSQLIMSSFFRIFGLYTADMFTLGNYQRVLGDPVVWRSFKNTLIIAGGGALIALTLATLVSYFVQRIKVRGNKLLDLVAWLPWTVPGTVLGLGSLWGYALLPGPLNLYGTAWILLVAYINIGLPVAMRVMTGNVVQISPDLEECSRVHGATLGQTLLRIVAPLVRPGFLAGAILLFTMLMRDLSTSIFLYTPGNEVVPVVILKYWGEGGGSEVVSVVAILMLGLLVFLRVLEGYFRRLDKAKIQMESS
ncbi:MAG: iron ABC transporter permease [Chloroflexi bacterium]|nr:iron ABC transporter permease [Chloroflexota bacterium]